MSEIEKTYDVVVIGCGIAGMSAAVTAMQQGAKVAVLERATRDERGGNTRYTEAFIRMKSEDEVTDDFEDQFMSNSGGHLDPSIVAYLAEPRENRPTIVNSLSMVDPDVVASFAKAAGPTIKWLKSMGASFEIGAPNVILTLSAPRMGTHGGGLALIEALAAVAEKSGVDFYYRTTAQDLIQDASGAVVGVRAINDKPQRISFRGAVVLACGGFQGNPEMLAQYIGPRAIYLRPVARGGYYNKGEGIRMALKIGAAPCGDYGEYHAEPVDPRSGRAEPAIFAYPYGILVNKECRRFMDESPATTDLTYEATARKIWSQPGAIGYMIFDKKIEDVPNRHRAIRTDQPPVSAPTIRELAEKLKLDPAALEKTVAEYNKACRPGKFTPLAVDGLATEGLDPPKSNWARPIDSPPYQAYPLISANTFTFGGLKVNESAQVVSNDGDVISGLYAAGEVVGLYYGRYTGATSVLKGAVFGRKAGFDAAQLAATRSARPVAAAGAR